MVRTDQREAAEGRYRIQTVAKMTGVGAAVLRAWERRYGVPLPQRTGAAYRLYSDADVAMVRRLRDLRTSGLSASEAAALVRGDHDDTRPAGPPLGSFAEQLLAATRRMDGPAIERLLSAMAAFDSATEVFDRVLAPVLERVGEAWAAGELTEAHEHLLSEHVGGALRAWAGRREADTRGRVAVACFAEELHSLPAYAFGLRLADWGFAPVVLGARVPPTAIRSAAVELSPVVIALSLTMPLSRARRGLVAEYAAACGGIPWIVGGAGAAQIAPAVIQYGGVVAPADPAHQRALVTALAGSPPKNART